MMQGPRRLSWGRSNSTKLSQGTTNPQSHSPVQRSNPAVDDLNAFASLSQQPDCDQSPETTPLAATQLEVTPGTEAQLEVTPAHSAQSSNRGSLLTQQFSSDVQQQVQRGVLRAVLAGLLEEDGPQLDHYPLTVQAVTATAHHRMAETVNRAREEERYLLTAEHKQHLSAVRDDAEDKANKLIQEANAKASAAAAQHGQQIANLQAQLSLLQREKHQLYGRSAQQSRDARQAAMVTAGLQAQLEQAQQQLQKMSRQVEVKEAAFTRCKQAHEQELAAMRAAVQQTAAADAQRQDQYVQQIAQLQQNHQCQLARLQEELEVKAQQQNEAAHQAQQARQQQQHCENVMHILAVDLQNELSQSVDQQKDLLQQGFSTVSNALAEAAQHTRQQSEDLQFLRSGFTACKQLAQQLLLLNDAQTVALRNLQQQVAAVAPEGLEALQQQLFSARCEQQAAVKQLQESSLQLAETQALQEALQQEKHNLQEQLTAARAGIACVSKELNQHKDLADRQAHQLELLQARVEAGASALSAAEALIEKERTGRIAAEEQAEQQQRQQQTDVDQLKQQLAEARACQEEGLQQLLQHTALLSDTFLGTVSLTGQPQKCDSIGSTSEGDSGVMPTESKGTVGRAKRATAMPLLAAAVARLSQLTCLEESVLEARYQQFLEHKQKLLSTSSAHTGTWHSLCNQTLQVEAGLLQWALGLQDVLCLLQQHHTCLQQQLRGLSDDSRQLRPSTAGSRCSDTQSSDTLSSGSGTKESQGDLAKQLLQALVRDKKQLTAQLRRVQSQRSVQHSHTGESPLLWQRSNLSAVDAPESNGKVATGLPAGAVTVEPDAHVDPNDDVDEVLLLLKGCQLTHMHNTSKPAKTQVKVGYTGTNIWSPASSASKRASQVHGTPPTWQ